MTRKPTLAAAKATAVPSGDAASVALTNSEGAPGAGAAQTNEGQQGAAPQDAVSEGQAQQAGTEVAGQSFPQVVTTAPALSKMPTGDLAVDVPMLIVTCHQIGGRRRAGRRWQQGETPVPLAELTDDQIEWLRGDPLFMIREA